MNTKPVYRLHLFFAKDNDRTVILRQGPSEVFRMILWHRDSDRFEDGQWLKHKVYVDLCDLSPDGQHFLYFALDGKWGAAAKGSYTAISRPPYFTALALFPQGDTWGGGGAFLNNTLFVADGDKDIIGRTKGLSRLYRSEPDKACPSGLRHASGTCAKIGKAKAARANLRPLPRDPALDLYDTQGGCLYRRHGLELELIRDFTDMQFEPIRAPYDWRHSDDLSDPPAPWHPADRDTT